MYVYKKEDESDYTLSESVNDSLGEIICELDTYDGTYNPELLHNLMRDAIDNLPKNYSVRFA
jgi:phage gp37-like protein